MNFTEFDVLIFRTMKKKCSSRVKYHWCVQVQTWSLCCVYILCSCSCYRHLLYITNTRRNDTMLYVQIIYSPIIFAYFSHKRVQTRKRNSEEKRRSLWWWSIYKYIYDWNYNRFNRQIYIQNFLRKKERRRENPVSYWHVRARAHHIKYICIYCIYIILLSSHSHIHMLVSFNIVQRTLWMNLNFSIWLQRNWS